jgi:hypothetical protein
MVSVSAKKVPKKCHACVPLSLLGGNLIKNKQEKKILQKSHFFHFRNLVLFILYKDIKFRLCLFLLYRPMFRSPCGLIRPYGTISYLWTYDLDSPVRNAFEKGKFITRASERGLSPGNRDFFGLCEMACTLCTGTGYSSIQITITCERFYRTAW